MLLIILPVLVFSESYSQSSTWNKFDLYFGNSTNNEDLLITLNKITFGGTLLFLAGFKDYPSISSSWEISSLYDDFYGYANNLDVLYIRVPNTISSILKNKLKISIFKPSSSPADYTLTTSFIKSEECHRKCLNDGECKNGKCKCSGFNYIGYDCGMIADAMVINKEVTIRVKVGHWVFYRLAYYENNMKLSEIITNKYSSVRVYELASSTSSELPSMISNDNEYYLHLEDQTVRSSLENIKKAYFLFGYFCVGDSTCTLTVKVYQPTSTSTNYFWIIITSVISLVMFCICTPVILAVVKRIRHHRAVKVADSQLAEKKRKFTEKYPETHFSVQGESESCTICLEEFKENVLIRTLNCTHYFHSPCILEWYMSKSTCPLCKRDLMSELDLTVQNIN